MSTCDDHRVPKPATGKTPVRNARVADDVWLPALAKAEAEGETASDAVTHGLRMYAAEPLPSSYDFTFANWPEAAGWHAKRSAAFAALESELSAATGFLPPEWLAIAVWLASTHHPTDAAQAKRVITGHVLRRAMSGDYADPGGWRGRYRDSRHLSETVQAILERHLPLGEG